MHDGFGARIHPKLRVDVVQVPLNGALADLKAAGNLLAREAACSQAQHVELAFAQAWPRRTWVHRAHCKLVRQLVLEHSGPGIDRSDRFNELGPWRRLEH